MTLLLLTAGLLGMGIVFLIVPVGRRVCRSGRLLARSADFHHTHQNPIPRLGGLALAMAFVITEVFVSVVAPDRHDQPGRMVVILGSLAMFALGFWDDIRPLGAKRKLLGQILIAVGVCCFGIGIQVFKVPFTDSVVNLGAWGPVVTVLWLVGLTNLINLIDGVDGLAGGICLMLMVLIAVVCHQSGSFEMLVCGMVGALLGFLWFNFPPARIYLGDGGAYFLGFQIGLFSIVNSHKGTVFVALVAPLFVLALPILDTVLAILRRALKGLPIFRPDRKHIHHHLINMGLSRRTVVLWLYSVTLVFLLMGLVAYWSRGSLVPVLFGVGITLLLFLAGKLRFSRSWFNVGRVLGESQGMRKEVAYALALTKWLELEATRQKSLDGLWQDFSFAAGKLGFTYFKISLEDGERVWGMADGLEGFVARFELRGGRFGVLEVRGRSCACLGNQGRCPRAAEEAGSCPCVRERKVFELLSELLAESWCKAATRWSQESQTALRFSERQVSGGHAGWLKRLPLPRRVVSRS